MITTNRPDPRTCIHQAVRIIKDARNLQRTLANGTKRHIPPCHATRRINRQTFELRFFWPLRHVKN